LWRTPRSAEGGRFQARGAQALRVRAQARARSAEGESVQARGHVSLHGGGRFVWLDDATWPLQNRCHIAATSLPLRSRIAAAMPAPMTP